MEHSKESILDIIHHVLISNPDGLSEYGLMQILRQKGVKQFEKEDLLDPITLFRSHFLLFHFLYELRDQLRFRRENDLDIHCPLKGNSLSYLLATVVHKPDPSN